MGEVVTNYIILLKIVALTYNLPPDIFTAVCYTESHFNANVIAKNDGGEDSIGLCQIKLSTARHMGYKGNKRGLLDPVTNATYAAKYFKHHLKNNNGNIVDAVISYNIGHKTNYTKYVNEVFKNAVKLRTSND